LSDANNQLRLSELKKLQSVICRDRRCQFVTNDLQANISRIEGPKVKTAGVIQVEGGLGSAMRA